MRDKQDRIRRMKSGTCTQCSARAKKGRTMCQVHLDYFKDYAKSHVQKFRDAGRRRTNCDPRNILGVTIDDPVAYDAMREKVKASYESGKDCVSVGKEFQVSPQKVLDIVRKLGGKVRRPSGRPRLIESQDALVVEIAKQCNCPPKEALRILLRAGERYWLGLDWEEKKECLQTMSDKGVMKSTKALRA